MTKEFWGVVGKPSSNQPPWQDLVYAEGIVILGLASLVRENMSHMRSNVSQILYSCPEHNLYIK